jgi:hypothetical protein
VCRPRLKVGERPTQSESPREAAAGCRRSRHIERDPKHAHTKSIQNRSDRAFCIPLTGSRRSDRGWGWIDRRAQVVCRYRSIQRLSNPKRRKRNPPIHISKPWLTHSSSLSLPPPTAHTTHCSIHDGRPWRLRVGRSAGRGPAGRAPVGDASAGQGQARHGLPLGGAGRPGAACRGGGRAGANPKAHVPRRRAHLADHRGGGPGRH